MGTKSWNLDTSGGEKVEFTKFPVGTTHIRVLDEVPHARWTHWMRKHMRSINCPGMKVCPIDDIINKQRANGEPQTHNRSRKFAMNIYNYETERNEIMEQGKTFMEDLKLVMQDAVAEGKELKDLKLKVRRTGTGKDDTKYRIDTVGDAEGEAPMDKIVDLDEYFKPHTPEQITRILNGEDWDEVMKSNNPDNEADESVGLK